MVVMGFRTRRAAAAALLLLALIADPVVSSKRLRRQGKGGVGVGPSPMGDGPLYDRKGKFGEGGQPGFDETDGDAAYRVRTWPNR